VLTHQLTEAIEKSKIISATTASTMHRSSLEIALALEFGDLGNFISVIHKSKLGLDRPYHRCGQCSLFMASLYFQKADIAEWLLQSECPPTIDHVFCAQHRFNSGPIFYVMRSESLSRRLLKLLLERGHHYIWQTNRISPLHTAIGSDNLVGVEIFLEYISREDQPAGEKQTQMFDILEKAQYDEKGSYYRTGLPHTPLCLAVERGNEAIVRSLLNFGADVNGLTQNNRSPLSFAAEKGHEGILRHLLRSGANPNIANDNGFSALMFALKNRKNESIVQELISAGSDVSMTTVLDVTALNYATTNTIATLLLNAGCINEVHFSLPTSTISILTKIWAMINQINIMSIVDARGCILNLLNAKGIFRIFIRRGYISGVLNLARRQMVWAMARGDLIMVEYLLEELSKYGHKIEREDRWLFKCSSWGRLESLKVLIRRGTSQDYHALSEAFIKARNHPNIERWLLVKRFTDQSKLCSSSNCLDNNLDTKPWSGVGEIRVELVGRYARQISLLEYIKWLHKQDKRLLLEYCLAAARESSQTVHS
jgi:Ankyrin repeats (3 copies)/Ankyrin repeat